MTHRSAFFCATPYQILTAINIKQSMLKDTTADIYILNHFSNAEQISNRLKDNNTMFQKIQLVNCKGLSESFSTGSSLKRKLSKYKALKRYNEISDHYFNVATENYNEVFFSFPDTVIQIVLKRLFKTNPSLVINLFEDGIGSYSDSIISTSIIKRIYNSFFGHSKYVDRYDNLYVFKPKLYGGTYKFKNIFKIPTITSDNKILMEKLNYTFDFVTRDKLLPSIIYFDQPMNKYSQGIENEIQQILQSINNWKIIVKIHPRTEINTYTKFQIYQKHNVPWEVIALNSDISNKILISYYSTSLFTNKIIFDEEPFLIFLFDMKELAKYDWIPKDRLDLIEKLIKLYKDPAKIFIPKNLIELKDILNRLN